MLYSTKHRSQQTALSAICSIDEMVFNQMLWKQSPKWIAYYNHPNTVKVVILYPFVQFLRGLNKTWLSIP